MKNPLNLAMNCVFRTSVLHRTHGIVLRQLVYLLTFLVFAFNTPVFAATGNTGVELEQFKTAWEAAKRGDHASFNQIRNSLQGYVLAPYLQYEDYRNRRRDVPVDEMSDFLETYKDWAFTPGLRNAWLKSLAKDKRWAGLVAHSEGVSNTVLRCQRIRGQIILKQTDGVLSEAQKLWAVGKSQPDECDPVFAWLMKNSGIPESLAWERVRLAIEAGNRSLAMYLARFVGKDQRRWLEDWYNISGRGYSKLERARRWPDNEVTRMIVAASLQRLSRENAGLAAKKFEILDNHFNWDETQRVSLLRNIALYCAVALEDETTAYMIRVPVLFRDSQLLEWWARFALSRQDWPAVVSVIEQMPEDTRNDDRWRYWLAQAGLRSGQSLLSSELLQELSSKANYYGFLAADELDLTYNICPRQADVGVADVDRVARLGGFRRALELRKAGLDNWALSEWSLAAGRLPASDLKTVAALAVRESWYDRAIFALGNSGDMNIYDWRFPLLWEADIKQAAAANQLDPAWVYGTIRSESAMVETARSSANAMGLMQITPGTGKQVARKHGLPWRGIAQLRTAAGNLPIGTAYMSDLLQDFSNNPVLVSGAYNAGPNAVERWLKTRPMGEAANWVETLPYFETRDYIPRVLAFTTIYDWRLGGTVKRISARMPNIESGKISADGYTEVVCRD
ncbi:MAG: transglycosylase SLT domain-containing protein [Xanthomonadales bacterium]|nr:transglycosylase SLT domain-containing protein [Xanthomonadales bacterium]